MADNLTTQTTVATVPSGSVIATDDAGGVHFQKVKLVDGTDGSTALIGGDATNGLDVDVTRVQGTVAVTQSGAWDEVGIHDSGNSITVDGTVTVGAITAGDNVVGRVKITDGTDVALVTSEGSLQTATPNRTATGVIDATNETVTISVADAAGVVWRVTGNLSGTLDHQVTYDGSAWISASGWSNATGYNSQPAAGGDVFWADTHGAISSRLIGSVVTSGSATIYGSARQVSEGVVPQIIGDGFNGEGGVLAVDAATGAALVEVASGTVAVTGVSTAANQTTELASLAAIESDADAIRVAAQLIDDAAVVLGTATYTEATSTGLAAGAVRRDADTTLVGTTNEWGPLQMDANGRLKVEAFSGETLPTSLATLPALVAGSANIGDVDVLTVPAPLSTTGSGTAATALRVELANNGTGVMGTVGAVTSITNAVTVAGGAAHASPASGNPVYVAGRASAVIPTDVGADADAAAMWVNRNGAQVVLQAPHVGLNSDPWNLLHEGAQYTTAQTSAVLVAGGAGDKIVVTQCQIQAFSTTAGTVIVYFGTGAFARGTNRTIFDGEFKPSSTLAPGAILNGPFISGANGDDILVTSVGDIDITVSVWYYIIT